MSDDRPNPLTDVAKGLGLLFRAARTAVKRLPKQDLEEVVVSSAREVGRAFENVATTIEREVLGRRGRPHDPPHDSTTPPPDDAGSGSSGSGSSGSGPDGAP
ncbi:MAG TPA: hypothetical protein VH044_12920 [Polyangiaceae bacterium]|jgi:hypothetical protein|nr:hypothetical protein [Polyangiaceae bacterium]